MVDINKLKARMALAGHNQQTLVAACKEKGYKISENTISAKINKRSKWTTDDADMLCDVLGIREPAEKAGIFLAEPIPKVG